MAFSCLPPWSLHSLSPLTIKLCFMRVWQWSSVLVSWEIAKVRLGLGLGRGLYIFTVALIPMSLMSNFYIFVMVWLTSASEMDLQVQFISAYMSIWPNIETGWSLTLCCNHPVYCSSYIYSILYILHKLKIQLVTFSLLPSWPLTPYICLVITQP